MERYFIAGARNYIILVEGSQASGDYLSDWNSGSEDIMLEELT
jgi:hypothetical protein